MTTDDIMALAAAVEWPFSGHELKQRAAAELRRLHAENKTLRYELDAIAAIKEERDALQDGEALLRKIDAICHSQERYSGGYDEILRKALRDVEALTTAIRKLHAAKGRYHTQLAACDLFDLVGLPNERPKK